MLSCFSKTSRDVAQAYTDLASKEIISIVDRKMQDMQNLQEFTIDEASYADILNQVRTKELMSTFIV